MKEIYAFNMYSITAEYVKVWFLCSSDLKYIVGCDSSVGIATGYGLDYPGIEFLPIPVAARSEEWVCGRWLAGIAGSNSTGGMDVCLLWVLYSKRQKAKPGQSRQKSTYKKQKTKNKKKNNPLLGRDFPHPFLPALGPSKPPIHWIPDFSGGKTAGAWR